jgi:hypothetical protein
MNLAFGEHFGVGNYFMGKEESPGLHLQPFTKKRLVRVSSVVVP